MFEAVPRDTATVSTYPLVRPSLISKSSSLSSGGGKLSSLDFDVLLSLSDPHEGRVELPSMNHSRSSFGLVHIRSTNHTYAIGASSYQLVWRDPGSNDKGSFAQVEMYDHNNTNTTTKPNKWTIMPSMSLPPGSAPHRRTLLVDDTVILMLGMYQSSNEESYDRRGCLYMIDVAATPSDMKKSSSSQWQLRCSIPDDLPGYIELFVV
jgi:hypothetical protein